MEKEEFIGNILGKAQKNITDSEKIQKLYEQYLKEPDRQILDSILIETARCAKYKVVESLKNSAHFRPEDVNEALQDGQIAIFHKLQDGNSKRIENFRSYCLSIYMHKAVDYVRKHYREEGKLPPLPLEKVNSDGETYEKYGEDSIGKALREKERFLRIQLSQQLTYMFCQALLNTIGAPQRPLALCYAKTLYQMECYLESKGSPATLSNMKWCYAQMDRQSLEALALDVQSRFSGFFRRDMVWNETYIQTLGTISPYQDQTLWKDLVYTDNFTKVQTSHWADKVNAEVSAQVRKEILKDPVLLNSLKHLISPLQKDLNFEEAEK